MTDDTLSSDDVSRLFRENDDVGQDSSLWLRPLRQLLRDGKPVGQVIILAVAPHEGETLPFGMLTHTERDRLVFWPILPSGVNVVCGGEAIEVIDHITLEFPSERIHVTAYDSAGQARHDAQAWHLHHLANSPLALWLTLLVRLSVLREQDKAVQRRVPMPSTDHKRRLGEFTRYTGNLRFAIVPLPPGGVQRGYIYCSLCLGPGPVTQSEMPSSVLPLGDLLNTEVEGWADGSAVQISIRWVQIEQKAVCVAVACPPGELLKDVSVGLPRSARSETTDID